LFWLTNLACLINFPLAFLIFEYGFHKFVTTHKYGDI